MDEQRSTVCCLCGDIGFPERLFRCSRCVSRFQHSYCSNYYQEEPVSSPSVCDWCLSEDRRNVGQSSHSKKAASKDNSKQSSSERDEGSSRTRKSTTSTTSSGKPTGRRYKLLKDVLC